MDVSTYDTHARARIPFFPLLEIWASSMIITAAVSAIILLNLKKKHQQRISPHDEGCCDNSSGHHKALSFCCTALHVANTTLLFFQTHRPGEYMVHPFEVLGAQQDIVERLHASGHDGLVVRDGQAVHRLRTSEQQQHKQHGVGGGDGGGGTVAGGREVVPQCRHPPCTNNCLFSGGVCVVCV